MPELIEHVNVVLDGRMPTLRHELKQLSSATRKLQTSDGHVVVLHYALGHLKIVQGFSNKVTPAGSSGNIHGNVMIIDVGSQSKAEMLIERVQGEADFTGTRMLAFTKAKVFNQPRLQSVVLARNTRLGMVVEEKPGEITLSKVEAKLKEWLPFWTKLADVRDVHAPYLVLRQRLTDETTGRLDGAKLARLFGLSLTEMAAICQVSKQSLSAHPTSKGIQEKLEPLVKAARGILWCGGDEAKFRAWLTQPNPDFPEHEGKRLSPLDLIRMGHVQLIADKVQNLLTGHPS